MNPRILTAVSLLILGSSLVQTSFATDLRWLNYSPIRFFTDKDWELARVARLEALNKAEDGQTIEWKNPDSDSHGSLTPVATRTGDGRTCRDLAIRNYANRLEGGGTFEFCQQPDGTWLATQGAPGR